MQIIFQNISFLLSFGLATNLNKNHQLKKPGPINENLGNKGHLQAPTVHHTKKILDVAISLLMLQSSFQWFIETEYSQA